MHPPSADYYPMGDAIRMVGVRKNKDEPLVSGLEKGGLMSLDLGDTLAWNEKGRNVMLLKSLYPCILSNLPAMHKCIHVFVL